MKLMRVGAKGAEKPAMLAEDGSIRLLSGIVHDIAGRGLGDKGLERIRSVDWKTLPVYSGDPRIGPCVGKVGKFICIGLNYADHAAESGMPIPKEPIIFMKATSAIIGPNDTSSSPRAARRPTGKSSSAIVIGKEARYVAANDAFELRRRLLRRQRRLASASSSSSAAASGTRARAATPSARSAPGS